MLWCIVNALRRVLPLPLFIAIVWIGAAPQSLPLVVRIAGAGDAGARSIDAAGASPDAVFRPERADQPKYIALQQRLVGAFGGPDGVFRAIGAGYIIPPHLGAVITGAGFAL